MNNRKRKRKNIYFKFVFFFPNIFISICSCIEKFNRRNNLSFLFFSFFSSFFKNRYMIVVKDLATLYKIDLGKNKKHDNNDKY